MCAVFCGKGGLIVCCRDNWNLKQIAFYWALQLTLIWLDLSWRFASTMFPFYFYLKSYSLQWNWELVFLQLNRFFTPITFPSPTHLTFETYVTFILGLKPKSKFNSFCTCVSELFVCVYVYGWGGWASVSVSVLRLPRGWHVKSLNNCQHFIYLFCSFIILRLQKKLRVWDMFLFLFLRLPSINILIPWQNCIKRCKADL